MQMQLQLWHDPSNPYRQDPTQLQIFPQALSMHGPHYISHVQHVHQFANSHSQLHAGQLYAQLWHTVPQAFLNTPQNWAHPSYSHWHNWQHASRQKTSGQFGQFTLPPEYDCPAAAPTVVLATVFAGSDVLDSFNLL